MKFDGAKARWSPAQTSAEGEKGHLIYRPAAQNLVYLAPYYPRPRV